MKKLLVLLIILTSGFCTTNAQSGFNVEVHGAIPGGDSDVNGNFGISDLYTLNLGLDVGYLTGEGDGLRYGGTVSYSRFLLDSDFEGDDLSYIELKATGEYDFTEQFYGSASLGYALAAEGDQDGGLVWMPAIGVKFDMLKVYGYYKSISDDFTIASYGVGVSYRF